MFHFPASTPTQTMYSPAGNTTQLVLGFPIRTSSDQRFVGNSPRHNAASHVLHRLSMPRHPPYARNKTHGHTNNQGTNTKTQKRKILASTIQFSHNTTPTHNQPQPTWPADMRAQQEQPCAAPDTQQCTNAKTLLSRKFGVSTQPQHHAGAHPTQPATPPSRRCNHDPRVCLHPANILSRQSHTRRHQPHKLGPQLWAHNKSSLERR